MGYIAVKGGTTAIEESIKRLKYERLKKGGILGYREIESGMRALIDQVMSESSLYDETLAAMAIKQAEGSPEEAVFLMRAYRSTLPRKHYSRIMDTKSMKVERRISASFKDIPGGQILGASYDYTHRLMDFELNKESEQEAADWVKRYLQESGSEQDTTDFANLPKVLDYLREEGLIRSLEDNDTEPDDVTKESVQFPTSRSQRLQILTRGQTGAVTSMGYAALRGYGAFHPTVGELRIGSVAVYTDNPFAESTRQKQAKELAEDSYYIGEIKITEVETLFPAMVHKGQGKKELELEIGYGISYGQNETKVIAMSILDYCLEVGDPQYPTHNEEFVLMHIDSVEATGFISHLKLPHYVTFQSKLDSIRKTRKANGKESKEPV